MKIPKVQTKSEYMKFGGGLDLESPALSISPGSLLKGMNYMVSTEGGYERIDGYERYSGQAKPSDATYYYAPCTFTGGGPAVGDTITGASSGSTGVVIVVGTNYIDYTKQSAAFTSGEGFLVGGVAKGTFVGAPALSSETSAALHATALNLAADKYRADIAKPVNVSSPVRGLALLNGVLYAFVDSSDGTYGEIYKATSSGWTKVTILNEISFSTGTAAINDGDTITQLVTGATALVKRVVLESGTWAAGTAAGRLIIGTPTGVFDATNIFQVSSANKATSTSLVAPIIILPGGRYETVMANFTGSTDTKRIYGCDGKNHGFEFDGTVYVPIHTGMTVDIPTHVVEFKQQLCFSFYGSSQNSAVGLPYQWTVVLGAGEIAIADDISGYSIESKTLLISSRNSTHQLIGDNVENFVIDPADGEIGALPWTIQSVGRTFCLDDRGIIQVSRAQEYGNFGFSTVSRKIQRVVNKIRQVAVASAVYRSRNQFRVYGSDGTGVCMTIDIGQTGFGYYFTEFLYPHNVACTVSGEDSTGKDVVFFGSDVGMVYQADKGSSFDGEEIEAYIWLPFNNSKSPELLKTYRKATLAMTVTGYCSIRLSVEFTYGDTEIQSHIAQTEDVKAVGNVDGYGGYWDLEEWEQFYYDTQIIASPSFSISGDGTNISLIIYSKTDTNMGHRIDGALLQYTPRRLVR